MKVRIVKVTNGEKPLSKTQKIFSSHSTYYKIQEKFLFFWNDSCEPETGMIWPTFNTLEEAEDFVQRCYFQNEQVVCEYDTSHKL